jgi:hypothetical protein
MASPKPDLPDDCLVIRLDPGTPLVRVHHKDNEPVWFGPAAGTLPGSRFDAPAGEFGTLYVADTLKGAFVETVLRKAARIIGRLMVDERAWSVVRPRRDLILVQLHGDGLAHLGVTGDICAGDDYAVPQALALALYEKFALDGIAYRARHNNDEICYALNDRVAASDLDVVETSLFSDNKAVADALLRRHGAVWDTAKPLPNLSKLS